MADDEIKRLLEAHSAGIREHVDRQSAETRRHMDVVFERHEARSATVNEAITSLDERTQRGFAGVEEKIANESSEIRAMIRLSYTELDRRLRNLEDRVDRLEQTTH